MISTVITTVTVRNDSMESVEISDLEITVAPATVVELSGSLSLARISISEDLYTLAEAGTLALNDTAGAPVDRDCPTDAVAQFFRALAPQKCHDSGMYTGTGVAFSVTLDFMPREVRFFDITGSVAVTKHHRMPDDEYMSQKTASVSYVTAGTGGITMTYAGFDVGVDADVNTASSTYLWTAIE